MGYISKVVWSEGMFLRPPHFQQQERYFESFIRPGQGAFEGFFWGFSVLDVDPDALGLGTILIRRARGLLPDGTPCDLAADGAGPFAFDFPAHAKNATVCLVLPPLREGVESVIYDEDGASAARFRTATFEAGDANAPGAGVAEIQIARPRFRLMLDADVPHGWIAMKMLRITERQADNALRVDRKFIPPTLNCCAQESLSGFIHEVTSLLNQRGEALAGRLSAGGRGGISEIGECLILMLINRWLPLMTHLGQVDVLHPERLYSQLVCLAGELLSFSSETRRAAGYRPARSIHPRETVRPRRSCPSA